MKKNAITSFLLKVKSKLSFQEAEKERLYCSKFEDSLGFKVGALSPYSLPKSEEKKKAKRREKKYSNSTLMPSVKYNVII